MADNDDRILKKLKIRNKAGSWIEVNGLWRSDIDSALDSADNIRSAAESKAQSMIDSLSTDFKSSSNYNESVFSSVEKSTSLATSEAYSQAQSAIDSRSADFAKKWGSFSSLQDGYRASMRQEASLKQEEISQSMSKVVSEMISERLSTSESLSQVTSELKSTRESLVAEGKSLADEDSKNMASLSLYKSQWESEQASQSVYTSEQLKSLNSDLTSARNSLASDAQSKSQSLAKIYDSLANAEQSLKTVASGMTSLSNGVKSTTDSLTAGYKDQSGKMASLTANVDGLQATMTDASGKINSLSTGADGMSQAISKANGDIQTVKKTADGNAASIKSAQGDIANLQTTASDLQADLANANKDIANVQATAKGLQANVTDAQSNINSLSLGAKGMSQSISDNAGNIQSVKKTAEGNVTAIKSAQDDITNLQTNAEGMQATLATAQSNINSLSLGASGMSASISTAQGDINNLKTTASGNSSAIKNAQGDINTLQADADGLKQEVTKKVDNTTYQAGISNLNNQINLKAAKSYVDGELSKKANGAELSVATEQIKAQASRISSVTTTVNSVSSVANNALSKANNAQSTADTANSKIDNLSIGGRNYLKNSKSLIFKPNGTDNFDLTWKVYNEQFSSNPHCHDFNQTRLSFDLQPSKALTAPKTFRIYWRATPWTSFGTITVPANSTSIQHYQLVITTPISQPISTEIFIRFMKEDTSDVYYTVTNSMLSIGDTFVDWSPAPEDVDGKIDTAQSTADNAVSKANNAQSTANTATGLAQTATTKANTAQSTADSANSKIDNLSIGGTNLLQGTQDFTGGLQRMGGGIDNVTGQVRGSLTEAFHTWEDWSTYVFKTSINVLEKDKTYYFGIWIKTDSSSKLPFSNLGLYARTGSADGGATGIMRGDMVTLQQTNTWEWLTFKFTGNGQQLDYFSLEFYNHVSGSFWWTGATLVQSDVAPTDWSPSPEDVDTKITDLQNKTTPQQLIKTVTDSGQANHVVTADSVNQSISGVRTEITKAKDELTGKLTTVETKVQQNTNNIKSTKDKTEQLISSLGADSTGNFNWATNQKIDTALGSYRTIKEIDSKIEVVQGTANSAQSTADSATTKANSLETLVATKANANYTEVSGNVDLNNYKTPGSFLMKGDGSYKVTNAPTQTYGILVVSGGATTGSVRITQEWQRDNDNSLYYKRLWNGSSWSAWLKIANGNDISSLNSSITKVSQTADGIKADVSTANGKITSLQTTADGLTKRMLTAEGNINTVTQTANGNKTSIGNATNRVTTLESTVKGLQTTVSNKVDTSTYNTKMSQLDSSIKLKADSSTVSDLQNQVDTKASSADLTVQANKISQTVTDLNNLQIGGRNLIRNTKALGTRALEGQGNWQEDDHTFIYTPSLSDLSGKQVTISADVYVSDWSKRNAMYIGAAGLNNNNGRIHDYNYSLSGVKTTTGESLQNNKWQRIYVTYNWITVPSNTTATKGSIQFKTTNPSGFTWQYKNVKAEYGNRATDWTPAPEDVDSSINAVQTSVTQTENTWNVNLSNTQKKIVSYLNASTEGIRIGGKFITLDGNTLINNGVIKFP